MKKAIFLDRDGVINYLVLNEKNGKYEAPCKIEDLKLYSFTLDSLKELNGLGYRLFIVTNQPDYVKGKTSLESLKAVEKHLLSILEKNNIIITEYYACFHHPDSIYPEYVKCECRKPKNYFLRNAIEKYKIEPSIPWMFGDRDTDIECGQSVGTKTILIYNEHSIATNHAGNSNPTFKAKDLKEATGLLKTYYPAD